MAYLFIIGIVVGITVAFVVLGMRKGGLARRSLGEGGDPRYAKRRAEIEKAKDKIMEALRQAQDKKITNDDVEKLLGVSDNTGFRYLQELEKEGKITQHGDIGRGVYYTQNSPD